MKRLWITLLFTISLTLVAAPAAFAANDYEKLLALAGEDDLLMVYTDPPQDIVSLSGARRVQPEHGISGREILIVNVSGKELNFVYQYLEPDLDNWVNVWEYNLSPGESVLLDTLFSEGIPDRSLHTHEKANQSSFAECEITYDGSGERGPVFAKKGDFLPVRHEYVYTWDDPEYYAFKSAWLNGEELIFEDTDEMFIYLVTEDSGLLGEPMEVTLINWDADFLYAGESKFRFERDGDITVHFGPEGSGPVYIYKYSHDIPEHIHELYQTLLDLKRQ